MDASSSSSSKAWEDRIAIVRRHFERKGYRVHSGLQFGCELVLYADDPSRVHSDFCVHVVPEDGSLDWRQMQSLVRSMPDLHKTLILAHVHPSGGGSNNGNVDGDDDDDDKYVVEELAMATEHAPFRHRNNTAAVQVGSQRKRSKAAATTIEKTTTSTTNEHDATSSSTDG